MLRATMRGLVAHRLRLALTALAVVLGVSFVAGSLVLTDTMSRAFQTLFKEIGAEIDVSVRSAASLPGDFGPNTRERVPATLLERVRGVDGVVAAEGSLGGYAQPLGKDGKPVRTTGAPTLGVNWAETPELSPLRVREGRRPVRDGEVAIDVATARREGFKVGDRVKILFEGPPGEFTLVGLAGFGAADNPLGAVLSAFDLATTERVLRSPGRYDSIDVVGDGPKEELRSRIATVLPSGYEAVLGETVAGEGSDDIEEGIGFFRTALLTFAFVALFVGAFIIVNTFSIIVAQRTREFGLLRALGASRRQVLASVVLEALVVGVVASAIGFALGVLVAFGLRALLDAVGLSLPEFGLVILPRTFIVSIVLGAVVTLVSSTAAARRAGRISPVAALRDAPPEPRSLHRRSVAGAGITAFGVLLLVLGLFARTGVGGVLVPFGAMLTFIGVAVLSPVIAGPVVRAIGSPLPRLRGTQGKLARENAIRNPRRTAATAAALMVGLGLVTFVTIFAASASRSLGQLLERTVKADYILAPTSFFPMSPVIGERLRERPELGLVADVRDGQWRYKGEPKGLQAMDPAALEQLFAIDIVDGSLEELRSGGILLHEDSAKTFGVRAGDTVPMEFLRTGVQKIRVAAVFAGNQLFDRHVLALRTYEENYSEQRTFAFFVKAAPGVTPTASRAAIEAVAAEFPQLEVRDQKEFQTAQTDMLNALLALVFALLLLAIVIALLGITNTLALSVIERTRELGLLRAVGMSRRQVRSMVRWEAVMIAILGALLGIGVGVFFGWLLVTALRDEGISSFVVPPGLAVLVGFAGVAGVAAAVFPARRAARLDILNAIATE